ncbi:uncharacterized protein LOC128682829 isoform X2 [Plodia interpunctella]|uniref:uncharacterized protein LOC128682829 isoform X2 n=1 Tax=Plodia interpunctella TaxID=58824 RepID=UPI002368DD4E|nr:uncharacterized protein LOC128682829 isoform X2 [Plodia interpunctella]
MVEEKEEESCKCIKIIGHLEAVKWYLWPRYYKPSPNYLALGDWTKDPFIWMHYVESDDGILPEDDVLKSTDSRYWSIHDVQRYYYGELHCEQVLFTYQYPNLRMPTRHGSHLWKANTALKLPLKMYQKELHSSFEITLKKMEAKQVQMNRLIVSDQLIKIDRLDYFKRQTFFRILLNIMSFQNSLELVSFENLCCKRLEGVRLIQQLACFNADSLKYLFLWRFVLPNENPLIINYSYITVIECCRGYGKNCLLIIVMATDEEKTKIIKLLENIDVPEVKLTERCSDLVKEFHNKFGKEVEDEEIEEAPTRDLQVNPYKVDKHLIDNIDRKLKELLSQNKKVKKENAESVILTGPDPKRPWRTNSNKEKLLRIDSELKRHHEKSSDMITPMPENEMMELVKECREETLESPHVGAERLRDTVDAAMKNLPNFQYKRIVNSTATSILAEAHKVSDAKPDQTTENPAEIAPVIEDSPAVVISPPADLSIQTIS